MAPTSESAAHQIAAFVAKFSPAVAREIRAARSRLRRLFPTAVELVYDNYNFLVFGFCASERASDCIVSLACSAKGVALSFYHGSSLADPHDLLQGSGSQNRFLRLDSPATLHDPEVLALVRAAVEQAKTPLPANSRGYTIIKSVSAKQRPRRV